MSISDTLKAMQKPEYVHVLLNHLPVTGLGVALVVLIFGPILRSRRTTLLGLGLVAVFAMSAYPVVYYGEAAFDRVKSMAYEPGQAWLAYHAALANTWKWLYYGTGLFALAALGLGLWRLRTLWWSVPVVGVLTIASLGAGAVISEAGGKIRHPEFRIGDPPAREKEEHEHDHSHGAGPAAEAARAAGWAREPDDPVGA